MKEKNLLKDTPVEIFASAGREKKVQSKSCDKILKAWNSRLLDLPWRCQEPVEDGVLVRYLNWLKTVTRTSESDKDIQKLESSSGL